MANKDNTNISPEEIEIKIQEMFDMANKKIDEKIAEAEKKASKIVADAKKSVKASGSKGNVKRKEDPYVTIKLPRDPQKGDRVISVNGKAWQIQRGVNIKVPLSVKEVIENGDRQDDLSLQYQEAIEGEFEAKLNLLR